MVSKSAFCSVIRRGMERWEELSSGLSVMAEEFSPGLPKPVSHIRWERFPLEVGGGGVCGPQKNDTGAAVQPSLTSSQEGTHPPWNVLEAFGSEAAWSPPQTGRCCVREEGGASRQLQVLEAWWEMHLQRLNKVS